MKHTTAKLLQACSLSLVLTGSAALVLSTAIPTSAFAKGNGSDNGNGGGNGNGSDNSKSEKSNGSESSKTDKNKTKTSDVAVETTKPIKPKKASLADELGLSASELGALNAAHASPNALANASPNSRVGKIAAYRDSVVEGETLEADLEAKKVELEGMTPPARPIEEIETDSAAAGIAAADANLKVAELEAQLAAAGGTDAAIEAELEAARVAATESEAAKATVDAELAAAEEYIDASDEVAELEEKVANQPEVERSLLEAAANKPVTDEVELAVKALLGLEP